MITAYRGQHYITRNSSFFKKVPDTEEDLEDSFDHLQNNIASDADEDVLDDIPEPVLRRSERVTAQPVRYPMDVPI